MALADVQQRHDQLLVQLAEQEARISADREASAAQHAAVTTQSHIREREWEDTLADVNAAHEQQVCTVRGVSELSGESLISFLLRPAACYFM